MSNKSSFIGVKGDENELFTFVVTLRMFLEKFFTQLKFLQEFILPLLLHQGIVTNESNASTCSNDPFFYSIKKRLINQFNFDIYLSIIIIVTYFTLAQNCILDLFSASILLF